MKERGGRERERRCKGYTNNGNVLPLLEWAVRSARTCVRCQNRECEERWIDLLVRLVEVHSPYFHAILP